MYPDESFELSGHNELYLSDVKFSGVDMQMKEQHSNSVLFRKFWETLSDQ